MLNWIYVTGDNYKNCTMSWVEQRQFTYEAVKQLGDHPVVGTINKNLKKLSTDGPDLRGKSFNSLSLHASRNFYLLLITFAKSLDPDQD